MSDQPMLIQEFPEHPLPLRSDVCPLPVVFVTLPLEPATLYQLRLQPTKLLYRQWPAPASEVALRERLPVCQHPVSHFEHLLLCNREASPILRNGYVAVVGHRHIVIEYPVAYSSIPV